MVAGKMVAVPFGARSCLACGGPVPADPGWQRSYRN